MDQLDTLKLKKYSQQIHSTFTAIVLQPEEELRKLVTTQRDTVVKYELRESQTFNFHMNLWYTFSQ